MNDPFKSTVSSDPEVALKEPAPAFCDPLERRWLPLDVTLPVAASEPPVCAPVLGAILGSVAGLCAGF